MEKTVYLIQWYDGEGNHHSTIAAHVKVSLIEGLKTMLDTEVEG